jgi:hypothetical protein
MRFGGGVSDWGHVRSVAEQIMQRIAGLARESHRRLAQAKALATPAVVRPAEAA